MFLNILFIIVICFLIKQNLELRNTKCVNNNVKYVLNNITKDYDKELEDRKIAYRLDYERRCNASNHL